MQGQIQKGGGSLWVRTHIAKHAGTRGVLGHTPQENVKNKC